LYIKRFKLIDKTFILLLLAIIGFGFIILASASSGMSSDGYYYIKKQAAAVLIGFAVTFLIIRFDYSQLRQYSWILYGIANFLLILVLIVGEENRGTTGWISLGVFPAVQPAEFTKVLLIISFADFLMRRKNELNTFKQLLPCFLYMGVPFGLIMLQPDLGTALVYIAITVVMMFAAGTNPKLLMSLIIGAILFIGLILFLHFKAGLPLPLEDYQLKRLTVFIDPYNDGYGGRGAGWNTIQSLIAIGSGGLTGKGLFNGSQVQLNFLPEHHTDFIYAVIGEELGFIGAITVIILYVLFILKAVKIAGNSRDFFGCLVVLGITAMWIFHIFENIGMSIGLMPITGIPLPFLSYGGSSMLTNLIAVGIILSINIRGRKIVF